MTQPSNGDRVIITTEYLLSLFDGLPSEVRFLALAPFCLDEDKARASLTAIINALKLEPASPAQQNTVEAFELLLSGYNKMSVFERKAIQKDLIARAPNPKKGA